MSVTDMQKHKEEEDEFFAYLVWRSQAWKHFVIL